MNRTLLLALVLIPMHGLTQTNLLQASMSDWVAASSQDKARASLAAAQYLLQNESPTNARLIEAAAGLAACVTETSQSPAADTIDVDKAMAMCWILLKK